MKNIIKINVKTDLKALISDFEFEAESRGVDKSFDNFKEYIFDRLWNMK